MKMMFGCFGLAAALKLRSNAQIMVKTVFIEKRERILACFSKNWKQMLGAVIWGKVKLAPSYIVDSDYRSEAGRIRRVVLLDCRTYIFVISDYKLVRI